MADYKMRSLKGSPDMGMAVNPMSDSEAMLPSFSLSEKDLPEIKDWKVGESYSIEVEVKMVSSSKDEFGKSPLTARFKIKKIGTEEADTEETMMAKRGHI